jgi:hypothetical protein
VKLRPIRIIDGSDATESFSDSGQVKDSKLWRTSRSTNIGIVEFDTIVEFGATGSVDQADLQKSSLEPRLGNPSRFAQFQSASETLSKAKWDQTRLMNWWNSMRVVSELRCAVFSFLNIVGSMSSKSCSV